MIKSTAVLVFNNTTIDLARASHATLDVSLSSATFNKLCGACLRNEAEIFSFLTTTLPSLPGPLLYMHPLLLQWPTIRALLSQIIYHFDAMITVLKVRSDFNLFS